MMFARIRSLRGLAALVAVISVVAPTARGSMPAAVPTPDVSGLYFRSDAAEGLFAAPVLSSDIDIDVSGEVARVTVTQHFRNPSRVWLEGVYVFPLPERAAVDRLRMRIGERVVESEIMEKEAAEKAYQAALDAGNRASLVSSARPNVFSTRVANIGPGEEVVIEIGYQDQVPFRDGEWSYRFPLVVAPRYTPAAGLPLVAVPPPGRGDGFDRNWRREAPSLQPIAHRPGATGDGRDLFGPVRDPADGAINPVSLAVRLDAGVPLATIASDNHAISLVQPDAAHAEITLASGPVPADRDFVLTWVPEASGTPRVGLFAETRDGASHLLVALMPPDAESWSAPDMPRDLVLILDKSGSMHGPAIAGARAAAALALRRLEPHDRFNLITFDNRTRSLFADVVPANEANIERAGAALAALEADGGTEMAGALDAALRTQAPEGRLRQIVFLTDGAVSNERSLADMVESRLGTTRLFTVGVGSAPNSFFMRRLAEAGRGTFTYIDRPDELVARMTALHEKLERPALTVIRVSWRTPGAPPPEVYPAIVPDLYIGDPVSFVARFDETGGKPVGGALTVSGRLGDRDWSTSVPLGDVREADGVAAVWGREKARSLRDAYPARQPDWEAMRHAVIDTALAYKLVTEFTSLVAIDDSEVARPRDETVRTGEIERNLPHGMDYKKVFGAEAFGPRGLAPVPAEALQEAALSRAIALPSTATPATVLLAAGALLLFVGLIVLVFARRGGAVAR